MKITRSKAIAFFASIGFPKASEWDDAKLASRLGQVPERIAEALVPDSFMQVYEELRDDPQVEFLRAEGEPATRPSRARPSTAVDGEPERDEQGAGLGTMRAAVNAALSPEWKTDKRIAKDAGIGLQQARRWLRKVMQSGKVEKRNQIIYRIVK